jgi:hypothetical protein
MGRMIFKRFLMEYLQKPCNRLFEMSKWWKSLENTLHVTHFVTIMQRRMFFPTTAFSLLYSSDEHGMSNSEFHNRCDNQGPTITIFILNNGVWNVIVFGVLLHNSWNSKSNGIKYSWKNGCYLFVVKEDGASEYLICTNESDQGCYYDSPTCGPHFGGLPANLDENFCGKIKVGVYFKNRKEITGSDKCYAANIQNVVVLKLNR